MDLTEQHKVWDDAPRRSLVFAGASGLHPTLRLADGTGWHPASYNRNGPGWPWSDRSHLAPYTIAATDLTDDELSLLEKMANRDDLRAWAAKHKTPCLWNAAPRNAVLELGAPYEGGAAVRLRDGTGWHINGSSPVVSDGWAWDTRKDCSSYTVLAKDLTDDEMRVVSGMGDITAVREWIARREQTSTLPRYKVGDVVAWADVPDNAVVRIDGVCKGPEVAIRRNGYGTRLYCDYAGTGRQQCVTIEDNRFWSWAKGPTDYKSPATVTIVGLDCASLKQTHSAEGVELVRVALSLTSRDVSAPGESATFGDWVKWEDAPDGLLRCHSGNGFGGRGEYVFKRPAAGAGEGTKSAAIYVADRDSNPRHWRITAPGWKWDSATPSPVLVLSTDIAYVRSLETCTRVAEHVALLMKTELLADRWAAGPPKGIS